MRELNEWSPKVLEELRKLPPLADVSAIYRSTRRNSRCDQSRSRLAVRHFSAADRRHTERAFGQRQVTEYFTQLETYFVVLEVLPELQRDPSVLQSVYLYRRR